MKKEKKVMTSAEIEAKWTPKVLESIMNYPKPPKLPKIHGSSLYMLKDKSQDWEKEFRKIMLAYGYEDAVEPVVTFISNLLKEQLKAFKEMIPKKKKVCDCEDGIFGYHTKECDFMPFGWNDAIDQILKNIKRVGNEI